jgi:hypothetical protein
LLLKSCIPTGLPDRPITEEQIHTINQTFDALHEEVAAARAPRTAPFLLFLASVLLPLAAALWLLRRAERSLIGADETLRILARHGLSEAAIKQYLQRQASPQQLAEPDANRAGRPELPRPREPRGRRRRRGDPD